jgi:predicted extracellular nuclease
MSLSAAVNPKRLAGAALAVLGLAVALVVPAQARAISPNLVVSEVYGGGGNTDATYTHDYIQIFNRSDSPVALGGLSLQYASATGTGNFGANSGQQTDLPGVVLSPGRYFLVRQASGGTAGAPLPTEDFADPTPINMSGTSGKVAIVTGTTSLGCNGGSTPCDAAALARIVDLVGYGTANFFEGAGAAPTLSNTTAALRGNEGCVETDNNASDFSAGAPSPASPVLPKVCDADSAPSVSTVSPADGATNVDLDENVVVTFSEPVNVAGSWFSLTCGSTSHPAAVSGGPATFTLDPVSDFAADQICTLAITAAQVTDQDTNDPPDTMDGDFTSSFETAAPVGPPREIHEIQGASHISPLVGQTVSGVEGIVTARVSNGFYMQDSTPDSNDATSDAIFVFTGSAPTALVGDHVRVGGNVAEFRPGGASSTNLTTTEISSPTVTVLSAGNALPSATVLGTGGRVPPSMVIDDDAAGSVETSGTFDHATDGIDFYESLEATRVQVNDPVVVGPRNSFGEIFVLADNGAGAAARTARGGIVIRPNDFNPERIQLDNAIVSGSTPSANVGDTFTGPAVGVLGYDFGNFEINLTAALTRVDNGLAREVTAAPGTNELAVATFNVENLDANESQSKFDALAGQIVNHLRSPDVIALEEIQDNNGATNDSVVDASATLQKLVTSIQTAGGPTYEWRQINPVDDQDGGEPGGNIRVGFLFRTDRGLAFVDRPGGDSTTPTTVVSGPDGPQLSVSPGRVEPANSAWNSSRKPLAGEFTYRGETFFLIANHFNSKGGDQPLFGRFQPPTRGTEVQRHQQAQLVNNFVDSILAADADANVVVIGDINDFEFSQTMSILEGGVLHDLMSTLPQEERYSYVFEGNSQTLDHIVISDGLFGRPFSFDPVHINAEFFDQLSDHDPSVALFRVNTAPSADAGGPYSVAEGGSVALTATGSDANGDALTFTWDLDNDGTFETSGQSPTFSAANLDGPSTHTVAVRVSDGQESTTDQATVTVTNVAPSATFSAPASALAGFPFTLSVSGASDPSAADTAAGFAYAFDCGAGYGAFGSATSATCPTSDVGARSVGVRVRDKDGGESEYRATVSVGVTFDSLCALTKQYAGDRHRLAAKVLCALLSKAEHAKTAKARAAALRAYRLGVLALTSDTSSKKPFTSEEAATLIRLSRAL